MKSQFRIQNSEFRIKVPTSSLRLVNLAALILISAFCFLPSALAGTHVTATYSLGANPRVMATVNGTPEYGLVFAQRNKAVTYNNVQYGTNEIKAYLDVNGQLNDGSGNLWLDLIPNLAATPADSFYVVTFNIQGRVHSEIWVVPEVTTISATLVRQTLPPSAKGPTIFYQFLQQTGSDLTQRAKLNFAGSGVSCADNAGQLRTDCIFAAGSTPVPTASATTTGTVKTDSTAADPVVYLKSSADSLLAAKVPTSRVVSTTAPLAGGSALSGDLTLSLPPGGSSQNGYLTSTDWATFNAKESPLTFSLPLARSLNAISCPSCVTSVAGTAEQINAGGSTSVTLAIANPFTFPGKARAAAPTAGAASFNFPSGVAPTSPLAGDFWHQGGALKFFDGTSTQSVLFHSRVISTTSPLAGGGALSADLTLSMPAAGSTQSGYLTSSNWTTFNNKENALTFTSPLARSADVISCPACEVTGNKNAASGYAGLTASAKLDAAQGQEVWSVTDLTNYSTTSGAGSTAILATVTTPATNDVLTWNGTNWVNQAASGGSHNLLSSTHPDTVAATPVLGDLLYANSSPAWTKLAGNAAAAKNFLTQTGTGTVSAAPSWGTVADADLPASIARDSEINVQGTANEIASSGSGVAPVLSVASNFDLTGKSSTAPVKATTAAGAPASCAANKDLLIETDATPAGQQLFVCNATGNGWSKVGDGGGSGPHNLLSSTHSDTTAAAVARGDLVVGQGATPTWQRLALGTSGKFLGTDGTDAVWTAATPSGSVLGTGRTLTGGAGITAIGDLSADRTISTASDEADFLAVSTLTCGAGTKGKGSVPSTNLTLCDNSATPTLRTLVNDNRAINTSSPLGGGGDLSADRTLTCSTCEVTGNKNGASGYAGLTASTKLNAAQGQEVWALTDLSDVAITSPATAQTVRYNGTSWVNAALACADVTNCPSLVASGTAGNGPSKAGDATTAARSNHDHRSIHTLTWFFAGTPSTGVQNMTLVFPESAVNFSVLDMRVTVNTTSASSSTFNIQRCTANCTGTSPTFANIYSANLTLSANTRTVAKAAAPDQNVSGLAAGDQFKANLVTIGSSLADVTVTMTCKYDTTN